MDWCWSWISNTLATWYEELIHLKRPWCSARLKVGGEGNDRGWDVWIASLTGWIRVWAGFGSWWWTGKEKAMAPHSSTLTWKIPWMEEPGRLQSMGSWRVGHDWVTSLHFSLSCVGEGNGNRLQCSCLENPRDGGAWWAAVYGVAQNRTRLKWLSSSSRWTGKPGVLQSMRSKRVRHDWVTELNWTDYLVVSIQGLFLPFSFVLSICLHSHCSFLLQSPICH